MAFGMVSGFFMPASQSIVPRIVGKDDLMIGNAIVQSSSLLSVLIGPLLAGGLISYFATAARRSLAAASPIMTGVGPGVRRGRAHVPRVGRHAAG